MIFYCTFVERFIILIEYRKVISVNAVYSVNRKGVSKKKAKFGVVNASS